MRVAPSRFERVMPERRSLFCLLKLVRVFLLFEAPRLLAGLATGAGGCPAPHNPCCSKEDVAMRYDFSPLYRSTVGFDRLFDMVDQATRAEPMANWPPYNIEKLGEDQYRITMAVAGFAPEEIQLIQQETTLLITGQKHPEPEGVEVLHRGLATRAFKQSFDLADHVKVVAANLDNGLLTIELKREVPEALKPRRIEIVSSGGPKPVGQENVHQIDHAKAA